MRPETVGRRVDCPEPWRWSAPDVWASESAVSEFLGDLVRLLKPDRIVETGAYLGFTSYAIGTALVGENRGRLVSLEIDPARAAQATARCLGLPVDILTTSSLDYRPDGPIDLLFSDSEFLLRGPEIRYYRQFASPRCVVALHDTVVGKQSMGAEIRALVADGVVRPWLDFPTPRGFSLTRYA